MWTTKESSNIDQDFSMLVKLCGVKKEEQAEFKKYLKLKKIIKIK